MVNKKSLMNLNPGKRVTWNGKEFKSLSELSSKIGVAKSTLHDNFNRDNPVRGHYIDELFE